MRFADGAAAAVADAHRARYEFLDEVKSIP